MRKKNTTRQESSRSNGNETAENEPPRCLGEEQIVALLLAEHKRISGLYTSNAEMGDKYFTSYLTILTLSIGLLTALGWFGKSSQEGLAIELMIMLVLWMIGISIFRRLIGRRTRMIEYLRAINRIHRYFIAREPALEEYLYWKACDASPIIAVKDTFLGGLRDHMVLLNGLSTGICVYLITQLITPGYNILSSLSIAVISSLIAFLLLERYGKRLLATEEKRLAENIHFPLPGTNKEAQGKNV